eukprot:810271-Prorocentrum_minimum.AAC.1
MVSPPPAPITPGEDPTSRLRHDLKTALMDFAWARAGVRDMASWAGQRLFSIWEVLEQGVVRNKNLLQLIHDGAHEFYPDPENGWNAVLRKYREAQAKVEEARATWFAFLSGREPPLSIADAPEEIYRNPTKGGTFAVILPGINEEDVELSLG